MPRAGKVCSYVGPHGETCPNLQPCPHHKPKPWQGSTRRKRLPKGWEKLRQFVLYRDPVCQVCGLRPSTEVDHIIPGDNHSPANLQGICADPCHKEKTAREAAAARRRTMTTT
jgi:5-methylcytosine-specific restriction protein A